jgi:hypothetical protein
VSPAPIISGNTATSSWIELGSDAKRFNTNQWRQTIPTATDRNKVYKLKVEGIYGVENNVNHLDAAYQSPLSTQEIGSNGTIPVFITSSTDKWQLNNPTAQTPPIPSNNPGYRNDHIYEYYLGAGDGTAKYFYTFYDLNSPITDNSTSGKLIFTMFANSGLAQVCRGGSVTLTSEATLGTINWYKDGSELPQHTSSITVSEPGIYTSRTIIGGVLSNASNEIKVENLPIPSAEIGSVPSITSNDDKFLLPWSNSSLGTDKYSINAVAPNALIGFQNLINKTIEKSPMPITIPYGQEGTFNFELVLINYSAGCTSNPIPFTVRIILAPPTGLTYPETNRFVVNQPVLLTPTEFKGIIDQFSINPTILPPGLSFNSLTGQITGTPTQTSSTKTFTVSGTNNSGSATATFTIAIVIPPPTVSISTGSEYNFTQYTPIPEITPSVSGATLPYNLIGNLPSGLIFNSTNGTISGTPKVPLPRTKYTLEVNNSAWTTPIDLYITVKIAAPTNLNYVVPSRFYTGVEISTISPTNSGGVISSYTIDKPLPLGLNLNPSTGAISGTPSAITAATEYVITGTNSNTSTSKTINFEVVIPPPTNLSYPGSPYQFYQFVPISTLTPSVTGQVNSYTIVPSVLPAGLTFNTTTGIISGTPTALSSNTLYTITAINTTDRTSTTINIAVVIPPPTNLSYEPKLTFTEGTAIPIVSPTVTGEVSLYTSSTLPPGLSIDPNTGIISGTPTAARSQAIYTITAKNSTGFTTFDIEITVIIAAPSGLSYYGPNSFEENIPITALFPTVTGAVSNYSVNPTLPAGLSLDRISGVISGTPTTATPATNYTITAGNSTGFTTTNINITVLIAKPKISYDTTNIYFQYVAIPALTPKKTGIIDSLTINSTLPQGLLFNKQTGVISGTSLVQIPKTIYTVTAYNSTGKTSNTVPITVTIPPPSNLRYKNPPAYIIGIEISTLTGTVSETVDLYSIDKKLPDGLIFNTRTGAISGTPIKATPKTIFTITASNVAGSTSYELPISVLIPAPSKLSYTSPHVYEEDIAIIPLNSTVTGVVSGYTVTPNLPDGLTLDTLTGKIAGTPTLAKSTTTYAVKASNSTGSTTTNLIITVLIARPRISYPEPVLGAQINPVYTGVDLFIAGVPNPPLVPATKGIISSIRINKPLPAGLNFDPLTGIISGTPTALSPPTTYVVTITNSTASTTDTIRIATVIPRPSSLSYLTPQTYIEKIKIDSLNPRVQGTPLLYTVDKTLPAGLRMNPSTGSITGTPTKAQDFVDYTITASNSTGFDSFIVTIKVLIAFPEIKYPIPGVFRQGVPVSFKPELVGIADSFKIDSLLPAGLNFDPKTGLISGTPTWPAKPHTYVVTATNTTGPGIDSTTITVLEDVNYDTDKDGYTDIVEIGGDRDNPVDTDKDGLPDYNDLDSDGDEIKDEWENDLNYGGLPDCDHDGVDNRIDPDACDPVAFQGISPNGDGKNDYLVIPGVMRTTPNTLTVFNRGGDIVYEVKDYANNWGGDTNRGNPLLAGDGLLPDGVYFYILDYNGVRPRVSTYIYINRLKK